MRRSAQGPCGVSLNALPLAASAAGGLVWDPKSKKGISKNDIQNGALDQAGAAQPPQKLNSLKIQILELLRPPRVAGSPSYFAHLLHPWVLSSAGVSAPLPSPSMKKSVFSFRGRSIPPSAQPDYYGHPRAPLDKQAQAKIIKNTGTWMYWQTPITPKTFRCNRSHNQNTQTMVCSVSDIFKAWYFYNSTKNLNLGFGRPYNSSKNLNLGFWKPKFRFLVCESLNSFAWVPQHNLESILVRIIFKLKRGSS